MKQKSYQLNRYLVGGAVRDELLGISNNERDWVVVGSTAEQMLAQGFQQVGKSFPVFLHPTTKEEYALARTERKSGTGYTGFCVHADPSVTLEQDLLRRDLTINSIAKDQHGNLIDPYHGRRDLQARELRHVSSAFAEDPLRVLRVARFKAKLSEFNFSIATDTMNLMKQLVESGELSALSADRVWLETEKALLTPKPSEYFYSLRECGALKILFPQVDALFGVPQRIEYHPEVDAGIHTMMVVDRASQLSDDLGVRFSALIHDLGKALTPKDKLPSHHGHEHAGLVPLKHLFDRYPVPSKIQQIAKACCKHHLVMHQFFQLRPATVLKLINNLDGFRKPQHIEQFALLCQADGQGRGGCENKPYPQAQALVEIYERIQAINASYITDLSVTGKAIGKEIERMRIEKIKNILTS